MLPPKKTAYYLCPSQEHWEFASTGKSQCSQCNQISSAKINNLSCKHCGHTKTQLISGDEMLLIGLELEHNEIERMDFKYNRQEVSN